MDLGATICISRAPRCLLCPAQTWCSARAEWQLPTVNGAAAGERSPMRMVAEAPASYTTASGAEPVAASQVDFKRATPQAHAATHRKALRPAERFEGSRRWYRGRIVDALRALPLAATMSLTELARQVAQPDATSADAPAADLPWLLELARALARDGLVDLQEPEDGPPTLSLPR
jgi:A/G-specific adenine glycosylase